MTFIPLSHTEHADLRLIRGTYFHFRDQQVISVSVNEAQRAGLDWPLAFGRDEKGRIRPAMILTLDPGNNVSIGPKGLWMGGYMPAIMRAYPFAMAVKDGKGHILIDPESNWISTENGHLLFDEQGKPTQILSRKMKILKTWVSSAVKDNPALEAIDAASILEPWGEISETLLRVNPKKLSELDDKVFIQMRQTGALTVVYAHLMSLPRINRIKNLAKRKQHIAQNIQTQRGIAPGEDTDFNLEDDDILSFD